MVPSEPRVQISERDSRVERRALFGRASIIVATPEWCGFSSDLKDVVLCGIDAQMKHGLSVTSKQSSVKESLSHSPVSGPEVSGGGPWGCVGAAGPAQGAKGRPLPSKVLSGWGSQEACPSGGTHRPLRASLWICAGGAGG